MNGWVNNGEAGDLRRHRAHYDVTVMELNSEIGQFETPDESFAQTTKHLWMKIQPLSEMEITLE